MKELIFLKRLSLRALSIIENNMKKYSWGERKRGNLQKSGIRYEIAAVTLFSRNDNILMSKGK